MKEHPNRRYDKYNVNDGKRSQYYRSHHIGRFEAVPSRGNRRYKDNYNSEPIQADTQKARKAIALEMLKGGMQVTAMGLNVMIGGNDARRWMTEVRRKADGYVVRTYPLRDRRVVYRLERINTDYNLFSGQEAADHE